MPNLRCRTRRPEPGWPTDLINFAEIGTLDFCIYPAFGRNTREGHSFLFRSVGTWESDVFAYLEQHLQP